MFKNKDTIEFQAKDIVFHFNKKHLEDPTVPMWVLKSHGVTFYVNHVDATVPWSTKETPDNNHTKGSLKFKNCKLEIDIDNNATISKLGILDKKLKHPYIAKRIITEYNSDMQKSLNENEFKHSSIKEVTGSCGNDFVICDILNEEDLFIAALKYPNQFRLLSFNEKYYFDYDTSDNIHVNYNDEYDYN